MKKEEYPVKVIPLKSEYIEEHSYYWRRSGSGDYSTDTTEIEEIVDRNGKTYQPVWGDGWIEIFPGVKTRKKDNRNTVRIYRSDCPVSILFFEYHEYVSYDFYEHNHQTSKYYWKRYEC